MSPNNSDMEFYDNILRHYSEMCKDNQNIEIWKNKIYIKLMNLLTKTENILLVRNSILLIISLFDNLPPDSYNNHGFSFSKSNKKDKKQVILNLKEEIE